MKKLGREVTTMKKVMNPVPGKFYAIDAPWDNESGLMVICLFSGKLSFPNHDCDECVGQPIVLDEIFPGSMVYYVGKEKVKELGHCFFYKVGYGDSFGFIRPEGVVFYDLGDIAES